MLLRMWARSWTKEEIALQWIMKKSKGQRSKRLRG
jgi:hypothetical protein